MRQEYYLIQFEIFSQSSSENISTLKIHIGRWDVAIINYELYNLKAYAEWDKEDG